MKNLENLSAEERGERSRVIGRLMRDFRYHYRELAMLNNRPYNDYREYYKLAVTVPPQLSKFLRVALFVRHHYLSWCEFIADPYNDQSTFPESIAEDKLLIFFLFWCDTIKVIHLNPKFPFLICDSTGGRFDDHGRLNDYGCLYSPHFTMSTNDDILHITKTVLKVWKTLAMPGKYTNVGLDLIDVDKRLQDSNAKQDDLNIGSQFYKVAKTFGLSFFSDYSANECYTELIEFDSDNFVLKCSAAVACDDPSHNTLETVHQLFPQFQELVGDISKYYVFSSRTSFEYDFFTKEGTQIDIFSEEYVFDKLDEQTPLLNQSIISMIKSHPELYVRWAVEPKLRTLYRTLVDPVSQCE